MRALKPLAALLVALPLVLAGTPAHASEPTTGQLSGIVQLAREGGMSQRQAERLARSNYARYMPYRVVVTSRRVNQPAASPADAHGYCVGYETGIALDVAYYAAVGRVADYYSKLIWCFNYSTVTYAATAVQGTVTGQAALLGWHYEGTVENSEYSYVYNGVNYGGFADWKEGHFVYDPIHVPLHVNYYPWIHLYAHYNGTSYYSWHG